MSVQKRCSKFIREITVFHSKKLILYVYGHLILNKGGHAVNPDQLRSIAIAIYTVNRHAKTAPDNKELYHLKKVALEKLIQSGDATKIGLHFSENPKFSKQHSTTLVQCLDFLFHMIPEKEDFKTLPHLGHQNHSSRNPQERMGLHAARNLLNDFVGETRHTTHSPKKMIQKSTKRKVSNTTSFRSSYLDG